MLTTCTSCSTVFEQNNDGCPTCLATYEEHASHDDPSSNPSCPHCNPRKTWTCSICRTVNNTSLCSFCQPVTPQERYGVTTLRQGVTDLLAYYPAEDVLAVMQMILAVTKVPLEHTDAEVRVKLADALDKMLKAL